MAGRRSFDKPGTGALYGKHKETEDMTDEVKDNSQEIRPVSIATERDPAEVKKWMDPDINRAKFAASLAKVDSAKVGDIWDWTAAMAEYAKRPRYVTGFNFLDVQLDGGLFPGLYVLGATPSAGKTSFVLQLADQLAYMGRDVLFFSLEMSKTELIAKSISRYSYLEWNGKEDYYAAREISRPSTTRDILNGKPSQLLAAAQNDYFQHVAPHVYIFEADDEATAGAIRDAVEAYTVVQREFKPKETDPPVIIVDYLQIIAPKDARMTDKMAVDMNVKALKQLSRDYGAPVVVVSSYNRNSYRTEAAMEAFKESGAIEYSCDVLLALQFRNEDPDQPIDLTKAKAALERDMQLVILKNRNGRAGGELYYKYKAMYNFFEETDGFKDAKPGQVPKDFDDKPRRRG